MIYDSLEFYDIYKSRLKDFGIGDTVSSSYTAMLNESKYKMGKVERRCYPLGVQLILSRMLIRIGQQLVIFGEHIVRGDRIHG